LAHPFLQLDPSHLLRLEAEVQLEQGAAKPSFNWPVSMDALQCLLRQSTSAEGAEVSLKVLHELQVFQVELDLMHQQMVCHEQLLVDDLELYTKVFDQLPQPCLVLSGSGLVHSSNQAAALWLGREWAGRDALTGLSLLSLLSKESQVIFHTSLLGIQAGRSREFLRLQVQGQQQPQAWQLSRLSVRHFVLMQVTCED
jgi:hypothetical protein